MKKLLFIFSFLLCAIISFAQSGFPNNQSISNNATLYHAKGGLMGDSGMVMVSFPDTITANYGPYIKNTNSIQIRVHDTIFIRDLPTYRWVKFSTSSNINPNPGCLSGKQFGDVVWDSLLIFHSTLMDYYIGCRHFQAPPTNFTLTPAFPSNPRTDVWVVDTFGVIRVVTGGISGLAYQPNPASELEVAHANIAAGAIVPSGISNLSIYKENVRPPEWTGASVMPGVLFNYPTNPFLGDSSTYIPSFVNGDIVEWQDLLQIYDVNDFSFIKFYVRLGAVMNSGAMNVTFYNGAVQATSTVTINNGQYGFNSSLVGTYQLIAIPFQDFLKIYPFQVNLFQIQFTGTGGPLQFDNIVLQAGGQGVGTSGVIDITGHSGSTRTGHYVIQKPDIGWFYDSSHLNSDSTYMYHFNNGVFVDSTYEPHDLIFGSSTVTIIPSTVGFRRAYTFTANNGGSTFDTAFNFLVSDSLSTPPVLPREGTIILVGTSPTGQFLNEANHIATRDSVAGTYSFQIPSEGNLLYNSTTGFVSQFNSMNWVRIGRALLHQSGEDASYGTVVMGSKANFGIDFITNNIQRVNISNTGDVLANTNLTAYGIIATASAFRGPNISSGTILPFYIYGNVSPVIVTNTAAVATSPKSFFTAISDDLGDARGTIPFPVLNGVDQFHMTQSPNDAQKGYGIGIYNKTNKNLFISDSTAFRKVLIENSDLNVAIGDTLLGPITAQLWVPSTTKGVLFAPMNTTQMNAISSPANGLMIYNTDSACYFSWSGSVWKSMCGGSGGGGGSVTASNGLTLVGSDVQLGGTLTGITNIDLGTNLFEINSPTADMLHLDPTPGNEEAELNARNNTGAGNDARAFMSTTNTDANFLLRARFDDGAKVALITGTANTSISTIEYSADTHTFPFGSYNAVSIDPSHDTISLRVVHASGAESLIKIGDDGSPPRVTIGVQDIPNGQTAEYLFQAGGANLSINSTTADQRTLQYSFNSGGISTLYQSTTTGSTSTLSQGINTGDHPLIEITATGINSGQTGQVVVTDTSININTPLLRINGVAYPPSGSGSMLVGEEFTGSTSTTLTLSQNFISGTIEIWKNGILLNNADFTEAPPNQVTLNVARISIDMFKINCSY